MNEKMEQHEKKMFWLASIVILLAAALCGWRIWNVNHTELIDKYKVETIIYESGSNIKLQDAVYYWDIAELDGYHMRVTNTKIMSTSSFLTQHHITMEQLKNISLDESGDSLEKYGLIYLVTAEFWNEEWMAASEWPILLDNFVLTGLDYFIMPATKSIQLIPDFNPELQGASSFSIKSDRVFDVVLPYLIDTESDTQISLEHLTNSETKLLLTIYPEESYLMLPPPVIEE